MVRHSAETLDSQVDAPNAVQSAAKVTTARAADPLHGPLRRENWARRFMRKLFVMPN